MREVAGCLLTVRRPTICRIVDVTSAQEHAMATGHLQNKKADWIKTACFVVIASYFVSKVLPLLQGVPVVDLFDIANPSLFGLAAALSAI